MIDVPAGAWLNMSGGVAISALGTFVAWQGRRDRGTRLFGGFLVVWGLVFIPSNIRANLPSGDALFAPFEATTGAFMIIAATFLALSVPDIASLPGRRGAPLAAIAVGLLHPIALLMPGAFSDGWSIRVLTIGSVSFYGLVFTTGAALALAYPRVSEDRAARQRIAALALGLGLYPFLQHGEFLLADVGEYSLDHWSGVAGGASLLAITTLWLVATRGPGSRAPLIVGLSFPAMFLAGMIVQTMVGSGSGINGIVRIVSVLIMVHAILRHQMLGLDVKVRWGISKGTVAAVILSVVFIASEGAQVLFGEDKQWLGLLAGGIVTFAIAPLQRAADRLAEKAVPSATTSASPLLGTHAPAAEDAFSRAVRLAMRAGITRREEHDLAVLADCLGLTAKRALEIREQVEGKV